MCSMLLFHSTVPHCFGPSPVVAWLSSEFRDDDNSNKSGGCSESTAAATSAVALVPYRHAKCAVKQPVPSDNRLVTVKVGGAQMNAKLGCVCALCALHPRQIQACPSCEVQLLVACVCVCVCVCVSVCLTVCLSVCLPACLPVSLPLFPSPPAPLSLCVHSVLFMRWQTYSVRLEILAAL